MWRWRLKQLLKGIGVRTTLYSLLGVATALVGLILNDYLPPSLGGWVGADAVDKILNILSSSMLAVTTFSLSTMVTAYGSASSGATPRATQLLIDDRTTQNLLSSFIGSFLFSVVGIIALQMGIYGERGKVILFVVTLGVLLFVVYNLLLWINHLTHFGRLGETTARVEAVTEKALLNHAKAPYSGGYPLSEAPPLPLDATMITTDKIGYLQHIDYEAITPLLVEDGRRIHLLVTVGDFITPTQTLAAAVGLSKEEQKRLNKSFMIGPARLYDDDPRFGLSALSEIASRALSPAVNDPGTAIDVIGRGTRLLLKYQAATKPLTHPTPHLYCPTAMPADFIDDFFTPISRDGASLIEVQITAVKALLALQKGAPLYHEAIDEQLTYLLAQGERHLHPLDYARLQAKIPTM